MHDISRRLTSLLVVILVPILQACGPGGQESGEPDSRIDFTLIATADSPELIEISGMESAPGPRFLVLNDDGPPDVFVLDSSGEIGARHRLKGAKNRDWEGISWVEHAGDHLLAVGDIGDNLGARRSIEIYFVDLWGPGVPTSGQALEIEPHHVLRLTYPDGPRDCEAMAYDASSGQILLLTKRDKPPRLYGVGVSSALSESSLELEFLGTAPNFRPPTRRDFLHLGKESAWISQPTGMDISESGTLAAVITYRSLYFFERGPEQTWAQAFEGQPREFLGPNAWGEEAVAFAEDDDGVFITSEGRPAPIWHAGLPKSAK